MNVAILLLYHNIWRLDFDENYVDCLAISTSMNIPISLCELNISLIGEFLIKPPSIHMACLASSLVL